MSKPVFRNPDKFQVLEFREWIRENLPSGADGTVVEDLDVILRVYGERYDTDEKGKFMLLELKYGNAWIDYAQKKTFGLLDDLLRRAGPESNRYVGFFVAQYDDEDWDASEFRVNRKSLTREEFFRFLQFDEEVLSAIPALEW